MHSEQMRLWLREETVVCVCVCVWSMCVYVVACVCVWILWSLVYYPEHQQYDMDGIVRTDGGMNMTDFVNRTTQITSISAEFIAQW